jgi:hypothetical protein
MRNAMGPKDRRKYRNKKGGLPRMNGLLEIHNKVINLRPVVNV